MRNTSRFLWVISFVIPLQAFACKCEYQTWFDLLTYDQHTYVMEIEVLGRIEEPSQALQVPPVETPTGQENLPPPFPPPFDYEDFNIRVLTNFKGDDTSIHRLRATNKSTSCYGAPQVGQRYLVYADGLATPEGFSALVITSACQRKIAEGSEHFQKEKQMLQSLKDGQKENFTSYDYETGKLPILEGQFKKGERSGTWNVYNPYATNNPEVIVRLRYRKGVLIRRKLHHKSLAPPANAFRFRWE